MPISINSSPKAYDFEVEIKDYFVSALRHWALILLCGLIAAYVGYGYANYQDPEFQSRVRFLIAPSERIEGDQEVARILDTLGDRPSTVSTFAQVVSSAGIFRRAARFAGLSPSEIKRSSVTGLVVPETNVVEATVVAPRREAARALLAEVARESVQSFQEAYKVYSVEALDDVFRAEVKQVAPQPKRDSLVAGVVGVAVGYLAGLIKDERHRSRDIKSATTEPLSTSAPSQPKARKPLNGSGSYAAKRRRNTRSGSGRVKGRR